MKKLTVMILVLVLFASAAFSQENAQSKLDAGVRLGIMNTFGGLSARYALSENTRIEAAIVTPAFNTAIYTGLFQFVQPFGKVNNFQWYVGGGLHTAYWGTAPRRWNPNTSSWVNQKFALGIDAVAGVEYNMNDIISFPLIVGFDYKPAWDILTNWADQWGNVSLSLRYAF
jgi:opacity protein-like surface antigen